MSIDFTTEQYINAYIISAGETHAKAMRTALNNAVDAVSSDNIYSARISYIRDTFDEQVGEYADWSWFWSWS